MTPHDEDVYAFLQKAKADDPEKYKEVCDKYPVLTPQKWRAIRRREITIGLDVEQGEEQDD